MIPVGLVSEHDLAVVVALRYLVGVDDRVDGVVETLALCVSAAAAEIVLNIFGLDVRIVRRSPHAP